MEFDQQDARLRYSWDMILCLEDFINCIKIHKEDLKSPRNTELMRFKKVFFNDKNFNPAGVLKDYIYLEANSFFQYIKKIKLRKKFRSLPDLPNYIKELKNFRDIMVGHRDFKEKRKFPEDWQRLLQEISKSIPIENLIKDVDNYYKSFSKVNTKN